MTYDALLGIGNYGYTDPYMLTALQSYNPNFKASYTVPTDATRVSSDYTGVDTAIDPTVLLASQAKETTSSHTGAWVGGALATAAAVGSCIYARKRGAGSIIKGFKTIWNDIKGASKEIAEKVKSTADIKLDKLMVFKDKSGKVRFFVPGKTKTYTGTDVNRIATEYGIDLKKLYSFKDGKTTIHSGTFEFKNNADTFTVTFKNGKIEKILNGGSDVSSKYIGIDPSKLDTEHNVLLGKFNDFIKEAEKNPKIRKDGLFHANITRQIGDNVINADYVLGSKPTIKSLTTLEALEKDSDAVKNYLYEHKDIAEIINSKDFQAGKILMEKTPEYVKLKYDGKSFVYKNGELQGFYENVGGKDVFRKKGSEKFGAYMIDHSEKVSDFYTQAFKNGTVPCDVEVKLSV